MNLNLAQLTSTRFFAAYAIVIYHYGVFGAQFGNPVFPFYLPGFQQVFMYAHLGVNYFFILSGFIMAVVYYHPERPRLLDRKKYWIARFARIYPIYALALLLVLVNPLLPPGGELFDRISHLHSLRDAGREVRNYLQSLNWFAISLNFTLLQSWVYGYSMTINPLGWSLSTESFFYLCFPFLIAWVKRTRINTLLFVTLGFWSLSILLGFLLIKPGAPWVHFPPTNLNVFLFGVTTGVLFRKTMENPLEQKRWLVRLGILAVACLVLVFAVPAFNPYLNIGILNPIFAWIIWWLAGSRSWLATRFLTWKPLVLLGEASYGVYILQNPVVYYLERLCNWLGLSAQPTLRFYIYSVGLILICLVLFFYVETPLRNFINERLGHRRPVPIKAER